MSINKSCVYCGLGRSNAQNIMKKRRKVQLSPSVIFRPEPIRQNEPLEEQPPAISESEAAINEETMIPSWQS